MGITMIATGGVPGNRSVLLFYPEGRTYSPPAKQAVVSLPSVGPGALHEASAGCFSRGGRQCRSVSLPSLSVRLADGFRLVCPFAANRCPLPGQPATRLRETSHRQLSRGYGRCFTRTVHFLLPRQKKQNRPLQGAERT